jgi:hypothetical protein
MPLTIINSFVSWVLKQRIHQIELFLKYPNEVQEELLLDLIQSSKILLWAKSMIMHLYIPMQLLQKGFYFNLRRITTINRAYPHGEQNVFGTLP